MARGEGSKADPQGLWASFTLPGTLWLILLFLVPFYAIGAIAFGGVDTGRNRAVDAASHRRRCRADR